VGDPVVQRPTGHVSELDALISKAVAYTRENLQDPPEIRDWTWERG